MLIGHQKIWQFLKKSAELGKISHAYLFYGEEQLGKKTLAIEFVKFLFGQDLFNPPHPDFIFVKPEEKNHNPSFPVETSAFSKSEVEELESHPFSRSGQTPIQISQIRGLCWKLSLKPFSAPLKAAIIDRAHLMNEDAQNCFLKTLEEPKGKTILILISEYPELLFPTILSRVQKLRFSPVKKEEIQNYLKSQGFSQKESEELSAISSGRPGMAIDSVLFPQKLETRQKKIKELIEISNSNLAFRFQYAKNLSRDENLRETLNIWLNYFRNLLIKCLTPGFKHSGYSLSKLKNIIKQIQSTNFLLSTTNVNSRLALEILMLEL